MLGRSPTEALQVDIVNVLVAEFWKKEVEHSCFEKFDVGVCDLILRPPSSWIQLAD
jgi:hypothetical protein